MQGLVCADSILDTYTNIQLLNEVIRTNVNRRIFILQVWL